MRTCLILVGGKGSRLKHLSGELPKPMLPVDRRPFLEYLIVQAREQGFDDLILCAGQKARAFREYFGDGARWGVHIRYSEESKPLGTGGALRGGSRLVHERAFLAMNGDSYLHSDFSALLTFHNNLSARATIALAQVENTSRFGRVEVGSDGRIARFSEKGCEGPGLISAGIYVFDRGVFEEFCGGPLSLEYEILPALIGRGLYGMVAEGNFIDMGTPEDYQRLANHPEILPWTPHTSSLGDRHADSKQSPLAY
jgi:NDP-sugar pyrophosphorylase family protein